MNLEIVTFVNALVVKHRILLGLERIESKIGVQAALNQGQNDADSQINPRKNALDDHGQHDLGTDLNEPDGIVVIVRPIHILRNSFWFVFA